ncbi:MAG TPA: hypothetical protein VEU96_14575 [Bryobacteraceae bacterium]|nr:hypothetical protein [Bryobacteraceae bacterium]
MKKKTTLDKAADQLAKLLEEHLAELSATERQARSRAFHQVVANIGTGAKSVAHPKTGASRRAIRRHV